MEAHFDLEKKKDNLDYLIFFDLVIQSFDLIRHTFIIQTFHYIEKWEVNRLTNYLIYLTW